MEILPAVLAIAHARALPAIAENAADWKQRHDLARDLGHELKIVGTQRTGDHMSGISSDAASFLGIHGDPVRMRIVDILVGGMRIGAREHHHVQLAATGQQLG